MLSKTANRMRLGMALLSVLALAGASHAAAPALPKKAVPPGMLELPVGGAGRILTSRAKGTTSARQTLSALRTGVTGYFTEFKLISTTADGADRNLKATFSAKLGSVPVRGLIAIRVQGTQGDATLIFDRAATFQPSNPFAQKVFA